MIQESNLSKFKSEVQSSQVFASLNIRCGLFVLDRYYFGNIRCGLYALLGFSMIVTAFSFSSHLFGLT